MVLSRLAVVLVAAAACVLAWRTGGGAEEAPVPPREEVDGGLVDGAAGTAPARVLASERARAAAAAQGALPAGPAGLAAPAPGYEVALRLLEATNEVRVDAPNAASAQPLLAAHWRKMRPAWFTPVGPLSRFVTSVALRSSATSTSEAQWLASAGPGKAWAPDAKVWNMNEGSFEQRDALVAMPPATFTFRAAIPRGAKLSFAEGTLNAMHEVAVFVITVVDAKGEAREVYRHRLPLTHARRWTEASCDLDAYAGQTVELRLSTESAPATTEERRAAARQREVIRLADLDAGAAADGRAPVLAAPPPPADDAGAAGAAGAAEDAGAAGAAKEEKLARPGIPLALWGSPALLAHVVPRAPYNVLWIVVDALRADVLASFHDDAEDAKKRAAPSPPLEALLPKVPGLTPNLDALAARGARFTNAYSAATWTRPGTAAMLAGARSSELGLDTLAWTLKPADVARFYASEPPLLPLAARRHGMATHAFVNNYFMDGYAPVGVDLGFEHVADHRYRTRDTLEITRDASSWITKHADTRFFLFVNYDSPHEPYEPPPHMLERVPPPPAGPADPMARLYLAEAAKDDDAIGVLLGSLARAGVRERTIVVLTADHGETLSSAHAGTSALDRMPVRYHHAVSNYEETTRVPMIVVAPGLLPEGREVKARVRSTDLAPTVGALLGFEPHARASGRSLVPLAKGEQERDERVVVSEGRGTRALIHGRHRLIVREGLARTTFTPERTVTASEELYDLVDDPGERHDLAPSRPELVAEMRARLDAALANASVAGSAAATNGAADEAKRPTLRLRFVGGVRPRRVSGSLVMGDAKTKARSFTVEPVELGRDALKLTGAKADVAFTTSASAAVGFDVVVDPETAPVSWELYLDDQPWPADAWFGGPYGLVAPALRSGITTEAARLAAQSSFLPPIDPRRDVGVFVVRERRVEPPFESGEAVEEMARLLREWGYVPGK